MDLIINLNNKLQITPAFCHGDTVYLITDPDQRKGIVTSLSVKPGGMIIYEVSTGATASFHYCFELTKEKDVVKATSE